MKMTYEKLFVELKILAEQKRQIHQDKKEIALLRQQAMRGLERFPSLDIAIPPIYHPVISQLPYPYESPLSLTRKIALPERVRDKTPTIVRPQA